MVFPGILQSQYKGVVVTGVFDYIVARALDPELQVKHDALYPYFKDSVNDVNDPSVYRYFGIRPDPTSSEIVVIGYPWIRPDSLQVTQGREAVLIISPWQQSYEAPLKDFLRNLNAGFVIRIDDKK
ncbi:hypothetical protein PQC07_gp234 [Aeromonas phage D3]|nr:hypothetical protein PQC07_gp234 [Aeromonas phage D3]QLM02895.1 hypothetical protein D3_0041 [Aeromonas phage D3]